MQAKCITDCYNLFNRISQDHTHVIHLSPSCRYVLTLIATQVHGDERIVFLSTPHLAEQLRIDVSVLRKNFTALHNAKALARLTPPQKPGLAQFRLTIPAHTGKASAFPYDLMKACQFTYLTKPTLKPAHGMILFALAYNTDKEDGTAHVFQTKIGKIAGLNRINTNIHLQELISMGLLRHEAAKTVNKNIVPGYRICVP